MKLGIISLQGRSSNAIARAAEKYFDEVDNLNLKKVEVHLTDKGIQLTYNGEPLKDYDCLYVRGSYRYALLQRSISRALSREVYMPVSRGAFSIGHDKFLTMVELHKDKIAVPNTYYAATTKLAKEILEKEVSYPVIMKVPRGTHGKGVMIADSVASAKSILDMLEAFNEPYLIQEFVKTKSMSDVRAVVVGNKVVAAYQRFAKVGEARANIHLGGERHLHKLTKEEEKLAIGAAKSVSAEICGVDILVGKKPVVIEVNLSPGIESLKDFLGIDVADEIAKFLFNQSKKFHDNRTKRIVNGKNGKKKGK